MAKKEEDNQEKTVPEEESVDSSVTTDESTEVGLDKKTAEEPEIDPELTVEEAIQKAEIKELADEDLLGPDTNEAIDDIVLAESDESLEKEDFEKSDIKVVPAKTGLKQKFKGWAIAWWNNKKLRYSTLAGLGILFVVLLLIPFTRYSVLNIVGVRVSSSMTVIDSQTRLPLKNINVEIQGKTSKTDEDGKTTLNGLKLGKSKLTITKRGYADNNKDITLGWGSNPIGDQELLATGEQFTFVLSDWKSDKAITDAEAVAGENNALADKDGKIILTVGEENIADVEVVIKAEGYREEKLSSDKLVDGDIALKLVPSRKHVFVSNRNGDYDLFKIDADQKNEEILLPATKKEREVPRVLQHPNKDIVAFVSSREGDQNAGGFVLDGLFIIDSVSGTSERIARSEQLQLIGWSGDSLIFWQVVEGTSQANPERSKLVSYNHVTGERIDLALANYFNDVELIGDVVYYAVSSYAVPQSQAKLFTVKVNGEEKNKLLDSQVWNIYRTAYSTLLFSAVDQKWYERVGVTELKELGQQAYPTAINFVDSPNSSLTAWVEVRDGKGVLLKSNTETFEETQVLSLAGLNEVLYWVNESTIVYRVISSEETADYILNLDGGDASKITDVTATNNSYF